MPRIYFQLGECFVGKLLNSRWKCPISFPEFRRGVVNHSFVERPSS